MGENRLWDSSHTHSAFVQPTIDTRIDVGDTPKNLRSKAADFQCPDNTLDIICSKLLIHAILL